MTAPQSGCQRISHDRWLKDIAPSPELREWYGHDVEKWAEFKRRYKSELKKKEDLLRELKREARKGTVTFVYAARDEEHNSALVLKDFIS